MKFIIDDIILLFIIFIGLLFIFSKKDYKILLPLLFLQTFINIAYFTIIIDKESDFILTSSFSLFLPLLVIFIFCFYEKMNQLGIDNNKKLTNIVKYFTIFGSILFLIWTTICMLKSYNIMNINLQTFSKNTKIKEIIITQPNNNITMINKNYILVVYIMMIFIINSFKKIWIKHEK